jgi:tetratricopeptide (TPR) repeat protein
VYASRLDEADERHEEALRIARDPLDRARADAAWGRSVYRRRTHNWPERTREIADASIAVFEAAGDDTWLARAHILRFYSTEMDSELDELKAARVHAERSGDERSLIEVWDELGGSMLFGPTPYPEVLEFMRDEVAWARERGVAFTEADGLLGEAYAWVGLGDLEAARARIDVVRGLFDALPSVVEQLGEALMLEALIDRYWGELGASADALRRSIEVFLACGETGWARSARVTLAHAELDLGRDEAAVELLGMARQGRTSMGWFEAQLFAGDARVALARHDHEGARELARAGSRSITQETTHRNAIRALELLGDVLVASGVPDEARPLLEDARARAEAKVDRVAEPRLREKLAGLR